MTPLFANRWLTAFPPIWLLGTGAFIALTVILLAWAILRVVQPRLAAEARTSLGDGFAGPLAWLLISLSAVALAFTPLVPLAQIGRSLARMTSADSFEQRLTVPAGVTLQEFELELRPQEIESLELDSAGPLMVRTQQPIEGFALATQSDVELPGGKAWSWKRGDESNKPNPFLGQKARLDVTNSGSAPVDLTVRARLVPEYPQSAILPWTTISLLSIAAAYGLFRLFPRRMAAVASATTKEAIGQPVFAVALILGAVMLLAFIVIPYNTFGEDVKMLKDSGLTLIKVLALLVVVWTASVAVAEEIEGRTALTVLSKPLTRWQFVLGKFIGLVLVALLVFLILGSVLLATTSLKVVYDAREGSKIDPIWRDCADEMITVVPGLVLSLLETILLAAVSLAVSTRLGMVPNLIICFTVYALGHLVPLIVQSSVGKFAIVRFVGQLFATILPVLEHFTIEAAVVGGVPVPWSYLGWAALYAGLYSAVALLVALVLFQDRDLA
jgi:ABC-type transport system involved in multi-copper enzyme maturation permease subunit